MTDPPPDDRREKDRAAIMALIEEETAAWIRRDPEAWAACWRQDDLAQHINARPSVGARRLVGFDAINDFFGNIMRQLPESGVRPDQVRLEDWRISIGADMAWASYDQVIPLGSPTDSAPGRHHEMRIVEKIDGVWKIVAVINIPYRIGYYESPWVRVDADARIIQSGAGAEAALRDHPALAIVGERLVGRRPADNRKLRDALDEANDLIRQRKGRPPIPVVLTDADDLSVSFCWVSLADMMTVVLLDDDQLLERAIARAGEVYRLSAAQMRVAGAIAQGSDLNRVAERFGVQPNTVRTHVRRMFERVGVNSQAGLVRALLSVDAPKP